MTDKSPAFGGAFLAAGEDRPDPITGLVIPRAGGIRNIIGALAGVSAPFFLVRTMQRNSGIRSFARNGFTLVELVSVIVLVAILAFTAIPRFPNTNVFYLDAHARQLASDIRYTQSLAMTSGQDDRIVLASTSYQITTGAGVPVTHPATGSTAPIVLNNVTLGNYNPPLTNNYIAFNGKGIPYVDNAGTALASNATIILTSGSSTRTVVVSPQTGMVAVQ